MADVMQGNVIRLEFQGPQGQQMFLVVDFGAKTVSVVSVDVRSGNATVTDVQSYEKRGG